jgi:hypothetical protein
MRRGKETPATRRAAARREREDQAPRLAETLPAVSSLNLEIGERVSELGAEVVYIRRVVMAAAPAHFEIPCGDPSCDDGGHDLTNAIMRALRAHEESFTGEDACHGTVRTAQCQRVLRYTGAASYRS